MLTNFYFLNVLKAWNWVLGIEKEVAYHTNETMSYELKTKWNQRALIQLFFPLLLAMCSSQNKNKNIQLFFSTYSEIVSFTYRVWSIADVNVE